jgi:hypothetical protein
MRELERTQRFLRKRRWPAEIYISPPANSGIVLDSDLLSVVAAGFPGIVSPTTLICPARPAIDAVAARKNHLQLRSKLREALLTPAPITRPHLLDEKVSSHPALTKWL